MTCAFEKILLSGVCQNKSLGGPNRVDSTNVTDNSSPQTPDWLTRAFQLPEWASEDPELVELHQQIVLHLRHEAAGLPMNTIQQLLLERIAFNYIVLKYKEEHNQFHRPTEQKDFNTWWLSMTQEFNKLLMANQDKLREALLLEVQDIVTSSLSLISSPEERRAVRRDLAERFASVNL